MVRLSTLARTALVALVALAPTVASAHTGGDGTSGLAHGFAHPIGGLDHVLAMVAVGLFAVNLGGRALWAVPLTFVAVMAAGGGLGMLGVAIPYVEVGIALSVVVLGLAVAVRRPWPVAAAMALVGVFAVFHGHAHGAEMPVDAPGLVYALGFVTATTLLHLVGMALGKAGSLTSRRVAQTGGVALAAAGVALLTGVL